MLEWLENRTLLSTINWNNPSGGDWDTASNWSGNSVPGAGDDAVISIAITNPITHSLSNSDEVHSLTTQDPINISGGTLAFDGASTVNNTLTLAGGTLTGPGDLTVTTIHMDQRHSFGHGKLILDAGAQMNLTGATAAMTGGNRPHRQHRDGRRGQLDRRRPGRHHQRQGAFNVGGTATKTLSGTVNLSGPGTGSGRHRDAVHDVGAASTTRPGPPSTSRVPEHREFEPGRPGGPVFNNAGTFRQTVTTGTTTFSKPSYAATRPPVVFNNSGTVDVETGTLSLQGGGTIGWRPRSPGPASPASTGWPAGR